MMIHYTNKTGYNSIKSQLIWLFKATQPKATHNPVGAYFAKYRPDEPDLAVKVRVPKEKLKFYFEFTDVGDLKPLPGGRGKLGMIFYSSTDYPVEPSRQICSGESEI